MSDWFLTYSGTSIIFRTFLLLHTKLPYNWTHISIFSSQSESQLKLFAVDYQPYQIEKISLVKIKEEDENARELRAEISFEPVEGNTLITQQFKNYITHVYEKDTHCVYQLCCCRSKL